MNFSQTIGRSFNLFGICLIIALTGCQSPDSLDSISQEDRREILESMRNYRDAWMKNDTTRIMEFISPDMILYMPNTKGKPKIGKDSIRAFWFPTSDLSYPITNFQVSNEQLEGNERLCLYSGLSTLSWHILRGTIHSDSTTVVSEFINVLRKENNQWKLYRAMYNIKDNDYR